MAQGGPEGVPLETVVGRTPGEETRWTATAWARGVSGEPGSGDKDPGRAAEWGAQRRVGRRPGRPSPRGEEVTLGGEGVRPNGRAFLGCLGVVFWISGQSLGVSNQDNLVFGFRQCSEWPIPRAPAEAPLCQRAGWRDRPRGHASPVARAPKPRASRLLVGPPAGGLRWGQEWGEVNPQPPASPRRPRHRHEWWPAGARPGGLGAQATPVG